MKGTDHFKRTIQMYLEQRAAEDALFAKNYRNPAKNIDDCVTYILNYVQRSGCNGFTDGEIFGQAVHYYDENEIEVGKPIQCQVAVNHVVELTAEERRKHGRTQSADTKRKNSASCKTAASREPPPKRPHKKYNNPTYSISDYETENTHTAGSRTIERATAEIDRHTEGIRFPPLLQALRHQEGGRHEHLHRVRTFVEE